MGNQRSQSNADKQNLEQRLTENNKSISPISIAQAHARIAPYLHRTPLLESHLLNEWLGGHRLVFKLECFQKTGAFKARGALNTLLQLKEQGILPRHVVAFSSGNHAQAVAYASALLGVKATILLPSFTSKVKQQATASYGAEVVLTATRQEAEGLAQDYIAKGACFIHPYDNENVIAGQGTACYEALQDCDVEPDAIFAPCGGGGLLSGTFLAGQLLKPHIPVYGAEPVCANDAAQSLRKGEIVAFSTSPDTIADGVRTLAVSERTFHYLKQLAGIIEVEEQDILHWTAWLMHLLKAVVEPTSAVAMAGAAAWLKTQAEPKTVLVILSGGNLSPETQQAIWQANALDR